MSSKAVAVAEKPIPPLEIEGEEAAIGEQFCLFELGYPENSAQTSTLSLLLWQGRRTKQPSLEKEAELGELILRGNPEQKRRAQHEIVLGHLSYFIKLARAYQYYANGIDLEELIQAALMKAVECAGSYDYRRGGRTRFSSYVFRPVTNEYDRLVTSTAQPHSSKIKYAGVNRQIHAIHSRLSEEQGSDASPAEVLTVLAPQWSSLPLTSDYVARQLMGEQGLYVRLGQLAHESNDDPLQFADRRLISPEEAAIGRSALDLLCLEVRAFFRAVPQGKMRDQEIKTFAQRYGLTSCGREKSFGEIAALHGFPTATVISRRISKTWMKLEQATGIKEEWLTGRIKLIALLIERLGLQWETFFGDYDT